MKQLQLSIPKNRCVTFDGKRLKRGLTKTSGDVDLLEFETCHSLQDRIDQLEKQKKKVEEISCKFCNEEETTNIADFSQEYRVEIKRLLREQLKEMSLNVIHARELRKKKHYGKEKLIEKRGGSDWKNGKYVFAISSLIAFIHDIDDFLRESLIVIDEIITCISVLNWSKVIISQDLDNCESYEPIQCVNQQTINTANETEIKRMV